MVSELQRIRDELQRIRERVSRLEATAEARQHRYTPIPALATG